MLHYQMRRFCSKGELLHWLLINVEASECVASVQKENFCTNFKINADTTKCVASVQKENFCTDF